MRKRTPQDFINDAKEVHREKYDYSEVNYVNRITKVKIICPEHGVLSKTQRTFKGYVLGKNQRYKMRSMIV